MLQRNIKACACVFYAALTMFLYTALAAGTTTVHIVTYDQIRYNQLRDLIAPRIESKHPGIKLKIEVYPWDVYWTKLYTLAASQSAPDVFDTSTTYFFEFATSNVLVKLDEYVKRDLKMEDYFLPPWSWCRYPYETGSIYGIPYIWVTSLLYYNKDLFDASGLNYPNEGWDWNNFLQAAMKLTKDSNSDGKIDRWGFQAHTEYTLFDPILRAFGGRILDETRTKAAFDNPGSQKALQFLVDAIHKYRVAPPPGTSFIFAGAGGKDTGRLGMHVSGSWEIGVPGEAYGYRNTADFAWDVAMLPRGPVSRVIHGHTALWAIMKRPGQNIETVWTVVKELIGDEALSLFTGGWVPVLRRAAFSEKWLEKGLPPANKVVILKSAPYTQGADFSPYWSQWYYSMRRELEPALAGERPVEECIKRANVVIGSALGEIFKKSRLGEKATGK